MPSLLLGLAGLDGSLAEARVVRVTIERREGVLGGRPFGLAGPYETLAGTVEFALDPALRQNRAVVDLGLAPRNERGEVAFTADVFILKPVDLRRGNGRVYYEVPNRGGKGILRRLQYAAPSLDPRVASEFGDGWLMEQGFALVWMGWQWDVSDSPNLLRLRAPIATDGGQPITGLLRSVIVLAERQDRAPLGDRGHTTYPAIDPDGPDSRLYVRDHRLDPPRLVPRKAWRFVDPATVALEGGFEPGRIYEVVYKSRDPRVVGCSLAATRDLVSFLKSGPAEANPLAGVTLALAHGISQSGRFLRQFVRQGFNEDEQGRRVFDGVFVEVAGAGGGSFNHRFAQASRDPHQHWNVHYPADAFPFSDGPATDPVTGEASGLLDRAVASGTVPKVFHVVTSYEYWNRAASLLHTDPSGARDLPLPDTSRAYLVASAQHGPGVLPPSPGGTAGNDGLHATNPNDFRPAIRALVRALDQWVAEGLEPPPSQVPRISDGTLARPEGAGWPAAPGIRFPTVRNEPVRMDYGPEWPRGVITIEPP
ncbi:MAG TPA: alpha/beta hydrolase domain-containing protein, partial [Vicinamibacteria bacterium]|nr:alpha/beta hydrolase domain-containing protein [Vicinamibacteria bacterium]